ncbi:hypothetical protein CHU98_g2163 [Xylaria longipes]|nr:hypothetical protein CHU98_g2163 [Xylaria longipes]
MDTEPEGRKPQDALEGIARLDVRPVSQSLGHELGDLIANRECVTVAVAEEGLMGGMLEPPLELQTNRRKEQGLASDNQLERGKRRGFAEALLACAILVGLAGWVLDVVAVRRPWATWIGGGMGQGWHRMEGWRGQGRDNLMLGPVDGSRQIARCTPVRVRQDPGRKGARWSNPREGSREIDSGTPEVPDRRQGSQVVMYPSPAANRPIESL